MTAPNEYEDPAVSDLDDNENVFDTPDDDGGGKDPDVSKQNAAFARLRKENADLKAQVEKTTKSVAALEGKVNQRRAGPSPTNETPATQRRRYRLDVQRRAQQSFDSSGEVFETEEERQTAFLMEVQATIANDATQVAAMRQAEQNAPRNVNEVLAEFEVLNEEEVEEVRERLDKLSARDKADPEKIRGEIHSYIGQNYRRFTDRQVADPGEEGEQRPHGTSPASGRRISGGKVGLRKAAETAANDVRAGARGVKLKKSSDTGRRAPQPLSPDDIAIIQAQGNDVNDPVHVREYLDAKDIAARNAPHG